MPWQRKNTTGDFPFVKITPALAAGIWLQWHYTASLYFICIASLISIIFIAAFSFLPLAKRFIYGWMQGVFFICLIACAGMLLTYYADIRNNKRWIGNSSADYKAAIVTIAEPLVEKQKSWKALANVESVIDNKGITSKATGKILIYFKKESDKPLLHYGSQIIITQKLQLIKNNGNPGALNYARVCLFADITHQCFLSNKDYGLLSTEKINKFQKFIYSARDGTLAIIKKYIPGEMEQGLAEALLIGYRNDLDRDLVQAYSNTGVVHIIAISGLHIGLVYGLLLFIFSWIKKNKIAEWIKALIIIAILWMFTLMAGAAPSILRATVMFTFLICGNTLNRNAHSYNSLASSAFLLLLINPFYLWDVGFQLSYAALAGIIIAHQKIYRAVFIKNKFLRMVWSMNAVTLSAQLFTLPVILYHFHQLPTLFLFTNLIAVPLSFLVLYAELLILCIAWWPWMAKLAGIVCSFIIHCMNSFVIYTDSIPFSLIDGIKINRLQIIMLLIAASGFCAWLLYRNKKAVWYMLTAFSVFLSIRLYDIWMKNSSSKLIVYNVPKYTAVDFINGRTFFYAGDTAVIKDDFLRNFNLKSGRIKFRVYNNQEAILIHTDNSIIDYKEKKILFLTSPPVRTSSSKISVDIIIISGNPQLSISSLDKAFGFSEIIFDSSNPFWKISEWKKECNALHLRCHSVTGDDAFIANF